jgi:CHAT domain-containing protein/tetratricopeptide (TPR) repeat protein
MYFVGAHPMQVGLVYSPPSRSGQQGIFCLAVLVLFSFTSSLITGSTTLDVEPRKSGLSDNHFSTPDENPNYEGTGPRRNQPGSSDPPWPSPSYAHQDGRSTDPVGQSDSETAGRLFADGESLRLQWSKESLRRALAKYRKALYFWTASRDEPQRVKALLRIGGIYYTLSGYTDALRYCDAARRAAGTSGDQTGQIDALNQDAEICLDLGDYTGASRAAQQALSLSRSAALPSEAGTLGTLGLLSFISGNLANALDLLGQSLKNAVGDNDGQSQARVNLYFGYTYSNMGQIGASLTYYQQSLDLSRKNNDQFGQALALTAIGGVQSFRGEKQEALDSHNDALKLFSKMGNQYGEAVTLNGIGYVYDDLGKKNKALASYERALRLFRSIGNKHYEGLTMGYLAGIYDLEGKKRQALEMFEHRLALIRAAGDRRMTAYALRDLAKALKSRGDDRAAMADLLQALPLSREVLDRRCESYILNDIGELYYSSGNQQQALEYYKQALGPITEAEERRGEVSTLYNIARAERDIGDLAQARSDIEKAILIIESVRTKIASDDLRRSYFETVWQNYGLYIDILMKLNALNPGAGFAAKALEAHERARARTLLDLLAAAGVDIRRGLDPGLVASEQKVQQQLNDAAAQRVRLIGTGASDASIAEVNKRIEDLVSDYQDFENRIMASSPQYAGLSLTIPLTITDMQDRLLGPGTLLLEYSLGESSSYLWVVSSTWIKSFELPSRAEIEKVAKALYSGLTSRNRPGSGQGSTRPEERTDEADALCLKAAAQLSRTLLSPAGSLLEDKRLVIVAEGALQYIPFQALSDPSSSDGQPLVINHEIISLPSASTLDALRKEIASREPAPNNVAVLADPVFTSDDPRFDNAPLRGPRAVTGGESPQSRSAGSRARQPAPRARFPRTQSRFQRLPYASTEVEAILKVVPGRSNLEALGFDASRATAMDPKLSAYRIIHFATHGVLDSVDPELSGLVLSLLDRKGRPQDGFLRLNEIYNLRLPADLVVLSACDTAVGTEIRGEGLIGLTRGFMNAGAKSVVGTLWEIDDKAAADLMGLFYEGMFGPRKMGPAAALRAAQIEMWRRTPTRFPYFWAAFVFQGEWN